MPVHLSMGSWYTWEEAYMDIVSNAKRFIKSVIDFIANIPINIDENKSDQVIKGQARRRQ